MNKKRSILERIKDWAEWLESIARDEIDDVTLKYLPTKAEVDREQTHARAQPSIPTKNTPFRVQYLS